MNFHYLQSHCREYARDVAFVHNIRKVDDIDTVNLK